MSKKSFLSITQFQGLYTIFQVMEEPSEDSLSSLDKYMTRFQFLQPFLMVTRLEKLDCLLNDNKLFSIVKRSCFLEQSSFKNDWIRISNGQLHINLLYSIDNKPYLAMYQFNQHFMSSFFARRCQFYQHITC